MMKCLGLFAAVLLAACIADQPSDGGPAKGVAVLENTDWKLTRLGSGPVVAGQGQREPNLVLRSQEHRVSGFTGCNQLAGRYTIDGQKLIFGPLITTKMACLHGMETETAFTGALQRVRAWSIDGDRLTLSDAAGQSLIVLEASTAP